MSKIFSTTSTSLPQWLFDRHRLFLTSHPDAASMNFHYTAGQLAFSQYAFGTTMGRLVAWVRESRDECEEIRHDLESAKHHLLEQQKTLAGVNARCQNATAELERLTKGKKDKSNQGAFYRLRNLTRVMQRSDMNRKTPASSNSHRVPYAGTSKEVVSPSSVKRDRMGLEFDEYPRPVKRRKLSSARDSMRPVDDADTSATAAWAYEDPFGDSAIFRNAGSGGY